MRVLVTGAAGQFLLDGDGAHREDDVLACDHARLDITQRSDVLAAVAETQPDAVVHAAAWTAVDACESDPERAFAVNALGTRYIAEACRRVGSHLVYVSTDYVFDGTQPQPYNAWDVPNPQSVYGRSKWAGERAVGT